MTPDAPLPDDLSVACPVAHCNAQPGERCWSRRGNHLDDAHQSRRTLAQVRAKPAAEKEEPSDASQ